MNFVILQARDTSAVSFKQSSTTATSTGVPELGTTSNGLFKKQKGEGKEEEEERETDRQTEGEGVREQSRERDRQRERERG